MSYQGKVSFSYRRKYDEQRAEEQDDNDPLHTAPVAEQLGASLATSAPAPPLLVLVANLGRLATCNCLEIIIV